MASKRNKKQRSITGRHILIACLFVAWMGVIIWRLAYLQIARHEELSDKTRLQQGAVEDVAAFRGEIVDRHGTVLASSIDTDSVMADLYQIKEDAKSRIIKTLAPMLRTNENDLWRKFNSGSKAPILAKKLDVEASNNIRTSVSANKLAGIKVIRATERHYPNGSLAAHILGYVDGSEKGVSGLEMKIDKYLRGQDGKLQFEKDAIGQAFSRTEKMALAGAQVITTIDSALQHKTEQALAKALADTQADSISAIVMDTQTGEILAMANAPTFDPSGKWADNKQEEYVRRNRAITDIYEPGSVFKIVGYSGAIEEGLVRPEDKIRCKGSVTLGSRIIKDEHCHGEVTLAQALAKSSNTGAIHVVRKLGDERFAKYIELFGFGRKTGIDLPAEAFGLARPFNKWQTTSFASIAIGQEIGVTAIQAVAAMSAIANRGIWVKPHIVKKIVTGDAGQRTLWEAQPETRKVISEQTAKTISSMLEGVVESGTARHAVQLAGYTAAGKTGTAQKVINGKYSDSAYVASFDGFVPATNPRFAIIVTIDNPKGAHQGGQVAAPVFNQIAQAALSDYGVLPDTEDHRQAMAELQTRYAATPKDWNRQAEATPAPVKVVATPTPKPSVKPTVTATPKPPAVKVKPTPKPTPILKLPTPKAPVEKSVKKAPVPIKQESGGAPNAIGRSLREVASLCNQAGLKLQANGSGIARSQRRVGDKLIVEFR